MNGEKLKAEQQAERDKCVQAILSSPAKKKLVVAGPGTGKTYLFKQLLESDGETKNLAMTFIRKLVEDMEKDLCTCAEVKTFHAYCKKILHQRNGRVRLIPYLTPVIAKDAELLGRSLGNFDAKFQTLKEDSEEVAFYLERGDYYDAVSFNDSVYRLYKELREDPSIVPSFNQIVIDEFQDFNSLEIAFIAGLENKGAILIAGDDDQAVYEDRYASPDHLRTKYRSGEYETFNLPFCSRCPKVVVAATNMIIEKAEAEGHLAGRISKGFESYHPAKEQDSLKYPKIITAQVTLASVVPKYIRKEIDAIDQTDIDESHAEDYPTVLIVGPRHYLREIESQLADEYTQLTYSPSKEMGYSVIEGYEELVEDPKSSLGWRIVAEFFLDEVAQRRVLADSVSGASMVSLLDRSFVETHAVALALIAALKEGKSLTNEDTTQLKAIVGEHFDALVQHFSPREEEESSEIDRTKPSILLTSYVGCKGLSAGHVFIVGANDGDMPKDTRAIRDIEVSQFIVALTRTRKRCHIVSNKWLFSPVEGKKFLPAYKRSVFLSWILADLVEDRGTLKAEDLR